MNEIKNLYSIVLTKKTKLLIIKKLQKLQHYY